MAQLLNPVVRRVETMETQRLTHGDFMGLAPEDQKSEIDTYEPDILFVAKAREHIIMERKLLEAPDLVVEILSASTARYDRSPKLVGYSAAGVRELWLIDPYGPAGTQFFQRQADILVEVAPDEGVLRSLALSGFELRVAWLWPDESGALPNHVSVLRELGVV